MIKVNVAKSAGFCFGVRDAIEIALDTARNEQVPVSMLGHIVHNEYVVRSIREAGVNVTERIQDIDSGILLIRAHGAVPGVYEEAKKQGLQVVDATCPLVLEIHEQVRELAKEGYRVIIIGDHGHDEVIGIAGQVKDALVLAKPEEVDKIGRMKKMGVVVQSTQNMENVQKIIGKLASKCQELKFINTICGPTTAHQNEIRTMPLENEVMIIVGSFTSANTKRLTSISQSLNPRTYQVESAADLRSEWFEGVQTVGISAGASTPDILINEVVEGIKSFQGVKRET
jgi:4-hydroxy-3-methylbut-2-enyl diphosphate reductase